MSTPIDAAWKYLSLGRSVIPTGSGPKGKKPSTPGGIWKPYQTRLPFEEEFLAWADATPSSWAVVGGAVSDNLTIIDADTQAAVRLFHDAGLEPHVTTPRGGEHYYFNSSLPSGVRSIDGITFEVRGERSYCNFAGATANGQYEIHQIALDGPGSLYTVVDLPPELQRVIQSATRPTTANQRGSAWPDIITKGMRNSFLTHMAGSIRHRYTRQESEAFLMTLNQLKCQPPLSVEEVLQIAASIERYGYQPEPVRQIPASYLRALGRLQVSPSALRILTVIFDRTVGLGKARDEIFRSQIEAATGILGSNVSRAIRELEEASVVEVTRHGQGPSQGASTFAILHPSNWRSR